MSCQHATHAPDHALNHIKEELHGGIDAEFGAGRQKCAAVAYERGYEIGQASNYLPEGNDECPTTHRRAPVDMLEALPDCQADASRHVCCVCAYHEGFAAARAMVGHNTGTGFINPADPAV